MIKIDMNSEENSEIIGILSKVMNLFTYSLISIIIKASLSKLHPLQIIFLMNVMGATITSTILLAKKQSVLPNKFTKQYLVRGIVFTIGITTWISSLKFIPITEATAISYLTPIMAGLFGTVILKEKFKKHIVMSLLLSVLGMTIILKPFQEGKVLTEGIVLALLSALAWSVHDVIAKIQTRTQTWIRQSHMMFCIVSVFSFPMALYTWAPMDYRYVVLALVIGVLSLINKFFLVKALAKTDLTILAPVTFLRLVFTAIMAYIVFGEVLDTYSTIGVIIVIYSTLLMVKRLKNMKSTNGGSGKS